jgi:3-hydroxyisobutyrate dehydrogenase
MDVAFIGLGHMGSHMASHVLRGEGKLVVHDKNEDVVREFVKKGATRVSCPAEAASVADAVLCSLPDPTAVRSVLTGSRGIAEGNRAKIVVDLSTTGGKTERELAAALDARGIMLLDGPVSGGPAGAEAGTLSVMVSGHEASYQKVSPILKHFAGNIFYLGEKSGLGQTMKLVNNLLTASCAIASFEALVFGTKAGLRPEDMIDVINSSSGRNSATVKKIPQCILPGTFPQRFTTGLFYKDVKLGVEEAEALGAPLRVIDAALQFLRFAMSQGDGPLDYANTIKHLEKWAGVEVRSANVSKDRKDENK